MAVNVTAWLEDFAKRGSLSTQELDNLRTIFSKPDAARELSDAVERQSDYSRKMAELQKKTEEEDAYATRLAAWEGDVKSELQTAKAQAQQYQQQLYKLAQQYSVDPTELNAAFQAAAAPAPKPAEPAPVGVTKEEVENSAAALFKLNAKMIGLNHEHMRLFGKPIENIEGFVDHALAKGVPIEQTFREFFNVADREGELREADVQARIQKAIEEEKLKWATNNVNPMGVDLTKPKGTQSPIFENLELNSDKIPGTDAQHRARVSEIVAAFNQSQASQGLPTS